MYPEQAAAIRCPQRYGLIEATPKSGKTLGCLDWLIEQALQGKRGWEYWWSAPVSDQAAIAYNRLKLLLEPASGYRKNETLKRVTLLPMGSVIMFKSGDHPDSLYGEDVHALVIDEASRLKGDAWTALRSTLTHTGGPLRLIGNVKGRKNWFYQLCRQAEQGDAAMHHAKLTAEAAIRAGLFPRSELEDAQKRMPEAIFRELYYAEAAEDEGNPFGMAAIQRNILLGETDGGTGEFRRPGTVAAWGCDVAETGNWNVLTGVDEFGVVCRWARWHGPWAMTKSKILGTVGDEPCLVDMTGVGKPLVEELAAVRPNIQGFLFTNQSKQELVGNLIEALQTDACKYPDGVIPSELRSFEYEYKEGGRVVYQAMEGTNDDAALSLALAIKARRGIGGGGWYRLAEKQAAETASRPPAHAPQHVPASVPAACPTCGFGHCRPTSPGHWQCPQCGASA